MHNYNDASALVTNLVLLCRTLADPIVAFKEFITFWNTEEEECWFSVLDLKLFDFQ